MTTRAFWLRIVSTPTSTDSAAVAQAPTGVLIGPEDESSSMLIHAATNQREGYLSVSDTQNSRN